MSKPQKIFITLIFFNMQSWGGSLGETIKGFGPDYLRPVATIVGSMTNSGWYLSSNLNKNFNFSVSIPISLVYLNEQDREYSGTYTDEKCAECQKQKAVDPTIKCQNCIECRQYAAPTIFGTIHTPELYRSIIDLHYNVIDQIKDTILFNDGIKELSALSVLPFLTLQATFSYYYSEIQLRYIGIPAISGVSFNFPGIGLQHDFHHFFPSWPISLSLAAHMTFLTASWKPGEDVEGTLQLNGLSSFIGILAGYKITKYLEVFLETGWDNSYLAPSGKLDIINDNGQREIVEMHQTISGRNGFKAALNFSFPIQYNPVIGGIAGAQWGNVINVLSYKSKNDK